MSDLTHRTTIYLNPALHRALQLKSLETSQSISKIVNNAIRLALAEDAEDLATFEERADEPLISFEEALKELKLNGKI